MGGSVYMKHEFLLSLLASRRRGFFWRKSKILSIEGLMRWDFFLSDHFLGGNTWEGRGYTALYKERKKRRKGERVSKMKAVFGEKYRSFLGRNPIAPGCKSRRLDPLLFTVSLSHRIRHGQTRRFVNSPGHCMICPVGTLTKVTILVEKSGGLSDVGSFITLKATYVCVVKETLCCAKIKPTHVTAWGYEVHICILRQCCRTAQYLLDGQYVIIILSLMPLCKQYSLCHFTFSFRWVGFTYLHNQWARTDRTIFLGLG